MKINGKIFFIFVLSLSFSCAKKTSFVVKWVNYDGSVLQKDENVPAGVVPSYVSSEPIREPIEGTTYTFNGWSPAIQPIYADTTYTATYLETANYTVTWKNDDGSILEVDRFLKKGDMPSFSKNVPSKQHQGATYFAFDGWDKPIVPVESNQTYTATYFPTTVDSDIDYDGLVDYIDPEPKNNVNHASFIFDQEKGEIDFAVDYREFLEDNSKLNPILAKLSVVLNNDCYYNGLVDINNEIRHPTSTKDCKALYEHLGCQDIFEFFIDSSTYTYDKNDVNGGIFAHHIFKYNNQNFDIVFLTLKSSSENNFPIWTSNLDVGADTYDYYIKEGETHPDWNGNTNFHKGFYTASKRIVNKINEYLSLHCASDNTILFINGHSRGGSIANLIGAHFELNSTFKTFTYTLASTNNSFSSSLASCQTIFNLSNSDDEFASFPYSYLGGNRYGKNISLSISNSIGEFNKLTGNIYRYVRNSIRIVNNEIRNLIPNRNSIYSLDESVERCVGFEESFYTYDSAFAKKQVYQSVLEYYGLKFDKENLKNSYYFKIINESNSFKLVGYNCPNAILKIIANIASYGFDIDDNLKTLFKNYLPIYEAIIENCGGKLFLKNSLFYPHYMSCYYIICNHL